MATEGKPILCRAAVCREAGKPLVIEQVWVAPPKAREVRVKIICTSLCHSDVTLWNMKDFPGIVPRILGHEGIGIVESLGENVTEVKKGDIVIPTFLADCEECRDCQSEKSNKCSNFPFQVSPWMTRDGTSRFTDNKGEVVYHSLNVSSFSEYTVIDVVHVTKINNSIPPSKACLLSCGVSTGVGAAIKTAKVEPGSTVAIFGIGAVGLAVAEGARISGASRIIAIDVNSDKFEFGKKFGVTDFINPSECGEKPISKVITEMTDGGADYCFECVGSVILVHEAFACCRKGWGKTIIVGVEMQSKVSISSYEMVESGKSLMGSFFGDFKAKTDIPLILQHYLNKEINLDDFVTHEVRLEEINKAFDLLLEGKSIRTIIWMDK